MSRFKSHAGKSMDISDSLINGAIGTAIKIHRQAASAKTPGIIFVWFDDPEAGNKSKSNCCCDELKDCVPTEAVTQQFSVSKNRSRNSGSAQVQILLAACQRFEMVRISDNGPGWK